MIMARAGRSVFSPAPRFLLRLAFRLVPPGIWLLGTVAAAAWYVYEVRVARPQMTWMGVPRAEESWRDPTSWTRILRNRAYLLAYSDWRGNPSWVVYRLTSPAAGTPGFKRPGRFSPDWRDLFRVGHDDYRGSGYERGHMAPSHAVGLLYGREAQWETFLMTNITPQLPRLNGRLWRRLEVIELDHFARRFGEIWVVTGPVFDPPADRLRSSWQVEIPDAFYKIMVTPSARKAIAFILPQNVEGNEPLDHYRVSVDSVEKRTGLDFFHELDDVVENRMEAEVDPEFWHLHEVAHLSARFAQRVSHERADVGNQAARKR